MSNPSSPETANGLQPFTIKPGGVLLAVRVTPRAKRTAMTGLVLDGDGRPELGVRLAAPPVDGAANNALCDYLARMLGVPRSAVTIRAGETSRHKRMHIAGDANTIAARLSSFSRDSNS